MEGSDDAECGAVACCCEGAWEGQKMERDKTDGSQFGKILWP